MNIEGKKVLIVGTGKSGIAAAALLSQVGAVPVLFDENESTDKREVEKKLPEGVRAEVITGKLPDQAADEAQLLVLSPGVRWIRLLWRSSGTRVCVFGVR